MQQLLYEYLHSRTGLSLEAFEEISRHFHAAKFRRGQQLVMEGSVCRHLFFVTTGMIRMYYIDEQGIEHTRYIALEGKFGTALTSFIEQSESVENVQALEKTEVLRIDRESFFSLVATSSAMNIVYRDILEMAYITSQKRIYGLQSQQAFERLCWLRQHQPELLRRVSGKVLASYLGVTPYTLSRLKERQMP